jgi:hypothetical protein
MTLRDPRPGGVPTARFPRAPPANCVAQRVRRLPGVLTADARIADAHAVRGLGWIVATWHELLRSAWTWLLIVAPNMHWLRLREGMCPDSTFVDLRSCEAASRCIIQARLMEESLQGTRVQPWRKAIQPVVERRELEITPVARHGATQ